MTMSAGRRRRFQPQIAPAVDWAHPLAEGLQYAWTPAGFILPRGVAPYDKGSTVVPAAEPNYGLGATGFTSTSYITAPESLAFASLPMTVLCLAYGTNNGANQAWISVQGSGAGGGWKFGMSGAGMLYVLGGVAEYLPASGFTRTTAMPMAAVVSGNAGNVTFYRDGTAFSTIAVGTLVTPAGSTIRTRIGASSTDTTVSEGATTSTIYLALVWNRALTASEVYAVSYAPYSLFRPQGGPIGKPYGPILSLAGVQNVTATTAQPFVTLTY